MVRNFYVTARADGRDSNVNLGPGSKDGGLYVSISQRDNGSIIDHTVRIESFARSDGSLLTRVTVKGHDPIEYITQR